MEKWEPSRTDAAWWDCRLMQPLWKIVWNFLRKLKMELPFDSVIPLLGIYPKNPEISIQKNLSIPMFIAVLFTIAKHWKQPKCPSVNEWIKKLVCSHNGILCTRKKEGAPTFWNSMDGTGHYYAKWNKPVSERQIPHDLIYKRNLMNKIN